MLYLVEGKNYKILGDSDREAWSYLKFIGAYIQDNIICIEFKDKSGYNVEFTTEELIEEKYTVVEYES